MSEIETIIEVVTESVEQLRQDPELVDVCPSDEQIAEWTAGLFTERGGQLRVRRNPAKGATTTVRGVHNIYRWHSHGGNLEGLMMARFSLGNDLFQKVDTFVQVVRHRILGNGSPALRAWERTGLFHAR